VASETPRTDLAPAVARAIGAAILGAGIWIGLAGPLNVTWGLLAVAIFVGWLVGSATRSGAGARAFATGVDSRGTGVAERRVPDRRLRFLAVGGALLAWLLALVGVYFYSLAALPSFGAAGSTLPERIAGTPILAFYAQQFGPLDAIDAAALAAAAWWSAR